MPPRPLPFISLALALVSCTHSNNLLLGEVRTTLATHSVLVTDCYRSSVPKPEIGASRQTWEPCRDARIIIDGEHLTVNGKDYGALAAGDFILVDHGVVSTRHVVSAASERRLTKNHVILS